MTRATELVTVLGHGEGTSARFTRNPSAARSRAVTATFLSLILLVAGWVRLTNLSDVGLRFEDEAAYFADARLWHRCAKVLLSGATIEAVVRGDKAPLKDAVDSAGIDFAARYHKPCQGYTALAAGMMFLTGDRDVALLAVNAVAGIASVLLLWLLASLLFDSTVGLCAAALLALSPFHMTYCRSAYPDPTMIFFVLAATTVWVAARKGHLRLLRACFATGCLFGMAATCHYRCGSALLALLLVDAWTRSGNTRSGSLRSSLRAVLHRMALMLVGFAVPILSIEATMRSARLAARLTDSWFPIDSFLEAAWALAREEHTVGVSAGGGAFWSFNVDALAAYPAYLAHYHGLFIFAPLFLGVAFLGSRVARRGIETFPLAVILVTGLLLLSQPYVVARGMSVTLPFLALVSAIGIAGLAPRVPFGRARSPSDSAARTAFALCSTLLLLSLNATPLRETVRRRGDLAAACSWLASLGPGKAVAAEDPRKYEVYLDGSAVELVRGQRFRASGQPREMLKRMRQAGIRWLIADPQRWHYRDALCPARDAVAQWWQELERLLRQRLMPIAEFPHVRASRWEFLAEGPGLGYLDEMTHQDDGAIRVYDLTGIPDDAGSELFPGNESASPHLPIIP